VWVDSGAVRFAFSRSSGPGGQAVNKLSTKAELRVAVESIVGLSPQVLSRLRTLAGQRLTKDDELVLVASTSRSQLDNKRACLERLCALVAEALDVPKPRKATKPSRGAIERRLTEKRRASTKKDSRRRPDEDS
jgi:ribosome-associated protein